MQTMSVSLGSRRQRILIEVLVDARKSAGLTQRKLAAKLKMPQSAVAAIEAGQRRVDVVEFLDIARAVKAPPLELLARIVLHPTK